jgi:hypothetical protein
MPATRSGPARWLPAQVAFETSSVVMISDSVKDLVLYRDNSWVSVTQLLLVGWPSTGRMGGARFEPIVAMKFIYVPGIHR